MFEHNKLLLEYEFMQRAHSRQAVVAEEAAALYTRALFRGWWHRLQAALTGAARRLLDLTATQGSCVLLGQHYAGLRQVPLARVRGTQGRSADFDYRFNPLRQHTRERWLSIAMAQLMEHPLPPISLVEIHGVYYVLDGHHRVSVARALGQREIEARVTVWDVQQPLAESCLCQLGQTTG